MLRLLLIGLCLCMAQFSFGQIGLSPDPSTPQLADTTDLKLSLLQVPSAPAFNLLGIEPSAISTPKDVKNFLVSLANASQSLSVLPNSFAMEIAPLMILRRDHISLTDYLSNRVGENIWQSFTISLGTNTIDSIPGISPATSNVAIAAKFSIFRGRVTTGAIDTLLRVDSILAQINAGTYRITDSLIQTLPAYQAINTQFEALAAQIRLNPEYRNTTEYKTKTAQLNELITAFNSDSTYRFQQAVNSFSQEVNQLTAEVNGLVFNRVGFKLDAAFGLVYDFPFQETDSAALKTIGAWLTGGQVIKLEGQKQRILSFLGSARLLSNQDQMTRANIGDPISIADNTNLDVGAKIDFNSESSLALSVEYLQRFPLNNDTLDPTYRLAFNGSYQLAPNYQISLTFGRNFDGTITEGGNLLAALHFFGTFGGRRANTSLNN
ncbi:MAG: OmpH family outer membrane protein [Bacteroidota bacterium]